MKSKPSLSVALIVVAVWLGITIIGGNLQGGGGSSLEELVVSGPLRGVWAALMFLAGLIYALKWKGLGLHRPDWPDSFRLMWLPGLFVMVMLAGVFFGAPPAPVTIMWIFINTVFVGVSEELAYRGILLRAMRDRFPLFTAVILTSVVFGLSHALNGFVTGDFTTALTQALAAAMSGVLFTALRVRTGSLRPVILLHALWDFAVFLLALSFSAEEGPGEAASTGRSLSWLAPVLLVTPNFLYGLYLIRPSKRGDSPEETGR